MTQCLFDALLKGLLLNVLQYNRMSYKKKSFPLFLAYRRPDIRKFSDSCSAGMLKALKKRTAETVSISDFSSAALLNSLTPSCVSLAQ